MAVMTLWELSVPAAEDEQVIALVEAVCDELTLLQTMKDTLTSYRGCTHWHYKQGSKQRGVLEITYWPREQRLWASVHGNRTAEWVMERAALAQSELEIGLGKLASVLQIE